MSGESSISVTVRVRPFTIREAAQITRLDDGPVFFGDGSLASTPKPSLNNKGIRRVIKVVDDQFLIFDPPENNPMARFQKQILGPSGKKVKDMKFGFDKVFDENAGQNEVYEATTRGLLDSVLEGFNATVFAYGATGCGKTHTISGTPQHPGIIFLTMAELFQRMEAMASEKTVELTLSYLEIYNETIRDLLIEGGSTKGLNLREDSNQAISVQGLSSHKPPNAEAVMEMIKLGNANRTMSPTEANATSSRSHAVLQINVIQKNKTAGISEDHFAATLSIIDLAGSERASVTKNRGDRLLEGANINRSLLALGNCINSLCDASKRNHIPYRDSKLTRLLKFSLGGNCKTVMIVCVSPSSQHYDETHNTLKYANRAKNIKTKVSRNMINVNRHVSQYVKAIFELQTEVGELKKRLGDSVKLAREKLDKERAARDLAMKDGIRRIQAANDASKEKRKRKLTDSGNLRLMEMRLVVIKSWLAAFNSAFGAGEGAPESLLKIRQSANSALTDLEQNKRWLQQRLELENWDKDVDLALKGSLQSLANAEGGASKADIDILTREANLAKATGDRDILTELLTQQLDTSAVEGLTKTHFDAIMSLNVIRDMDPEQAAVEAAQLLSNIIQLCTDATSQVIKPNGELVGMDTYKPATPGKRRSSIALNASPVKRNNLFAPAPNLESFIEEIASPPPAKAGPLIHKVTSKKSKGVYRKQRGTPKKAAKSVKWGEDVKFNDGKDTKKKLDAAAAAGYSTFPSESIVNVPEESYMTQDYSISEAPADEEDRSFDTRSLQPLSAPAVRNTRMNIGFLSTKTEGGNTNSSSSSPETWTSKSAALNSTGGPLREFNMDAFNNRQSINANANNNAITNSSANHGPVHPTSAFTDASGGSVFTSNPTTRPQAFTEPYADTYSSSDELTSVQRPRPFQPTRVSAAAQTALKSALKRSSHPSLATAVAGIAAGEQRSASSTLTATTAAQRARRRSPPLRQREHLSPDTSMRSGSGAPIRRTVKTDKENGGGVFPKTLSPRSSGQLMKATSIRRSIMPGQFNSENLLGQLEKEQDGFPEATISVGGVMGPPVRDSGAGKPIWR